MLRLRAAAIAAFEESLKGNEAILLPTAPIQAPLIAAVRDDTAFHRANGLALRNPRIANLLDCPSISLPARVSEGVLPVGLMLMGRRNADRNFLAMSAFVEAVLSHV
jgi:aspartyl-tRNA(Asn)/glutamyl-tRNA(Gln) amidotransferase subunit A